MGVISQLADEVRATDGLFLVVTGAGISLASGIPTFRGTDKDAVWKKDVTELGTRGFFEENPAGSWAWYLKRFEGLHDAQPNAGHRALVQIEKLRKSSARGDERFLLVTQNIDGLHARAGSTGLVEVHGNADRVRCSAEGCVNGAPAGSLPRRDFDLAAFQADPVDARVPRCPACGERMRQHVLWFDEFYNGHDSYQWDRVQRAAVSAELLLFVGTSFSVGVTELMLQAARMRGIKAYSIDPAARPVPGVVSIAEKSEVALVELAKALEKPA